MGWTVETLNAAVDVEIAALAPDLRARLVRVAELIEEHGLDAVPPSSRSTSGIGSGKSA
jgi:hypothetical protein